MSEVEEALNQISGGRVLDVATGRGNFIHVLREHLKDYTDITGIDSSEKALDIAREALDETDLQLIPMDAHHMDFEDHTFDTVCISFSLHHMDDLPQVLEEMKRVLKPGGRMVINEMYHDGLTDTQLTHVYMHHWSAEIDTARGITHNQTFTREEILEIIEGLGLSKLEIYEYKDLSSDPKDGNLVERQSQVIDQVIQRAEGLPEYEMFAQRGEEIRRHLMEYGVHGATSIVAIGVKP
jgi:ubiquinone/menaquinone biosynthesis C-methylase UbiE